MQLRTPASCIGRKKFQGAEPRWGGESGEWQVTRGGGLRHTGQNRLGWVGGEEGTQAAGEGAQGGSVLRGTSEAMASAVRSSGRVGLGKKETLCPR